MVSKGMSTSIVIIVAAVVILITALVVMGVFTGGLGTFQSIFNPWANETGNTARCQSTCKTLCTFNPEGNPPNGYPDDCMSIYTCNCVSETK